MDEIKKLLGPTFTKMLTVLNTDPAGMLEILPSGYTKFDEDEINPFLEDREITLFGRITRKDKVQYVRQKLTVFKFYLFSQDEEIECTIFNRHFLSNVLIPGREVIVTGKYSYRKSRLSVKTIIYTHLEEYADKIMPKYKLPEGLKGRIYRKYLRRLLDFYVNENLLPDIIPQNFINKYHLPLKVEAMENVHFPQNEIDITQGLKYFKYQEYLIYATRMHLMSLEAGSNQGLVRKINQTIINDFIAQLPYQLTQDQNKAVLEILQDLSSNKKMFRLLQGEVSSGKTIVAFIAALAIISGGGQVAYMAPTELLARQIYANACRMLKEKDSIALITGGTGKKEKEQILQNLANGQIKFIIGTHSLIEDNIIFDKLELAIIDEQQRFGVEQRSAIINKGAAVDTLIMSATPVPRTLAMILYGSCDLSELTVLPYGKRNVETELFPYSDSIFTYKLTKKILDKGEQVIIVCPLIDESLGQGALNVTTIYEQLSEQFQALEKKVAYCHSQVGIEERSALLEQFAAGTIDVLITTVIIEVGIDIPNLKNMIILDAEYFGMAQIHQLRGRIGRDGSAAKCILCTANRGAEIHERLKFIATHDDGFAIAEYDLNRRGPGELLGVAQSGKTLIDSMSMSILTSAQEDAVEIINNPVQYQKFISFVKNITKDEFFV